jgi:GTP-binding protein YchF
MSFSIGIVGLPNVGKSTLFKSLTKKQVDISAYPFCTINPNVGVVKVPDQRLDKLAKVLKPKEVISTTIEFVDIAGLIKNAHQGEGLGNQFLSHIREVDAICHLVRAFEDEKVSRPEAKVDYRLKPELQAKEDIETVNLELIFADLAVIEKQLEKLKKEAKQKLNKEASKILTVIEKIKTCLENGRMALQAELAEEEKKLIKDLSLLTLKPMLYVWNVDENQIPNSKFQIPINAKLEAELADLSLEEIKELGFEASGLDQLIKVSCQLLNLITFFTCQNNILQAWTLKTGGSIIEAAGRIHTDFAEGFIKAEVINWQKLVEAGSETEAHTKGWIRIEGRRYMVEDGDVIKIKN